MKKLYIGIDLGTSAMKLLLVYSDSTVDGGDDPYHDKYV